MNNRKLPDVYSDLRNEKGLSQTELANKLNCNKQLISKLESGERSLSMAMLKAYADFFNVTTDYLLGLTDIKTSDMELKAVCEYIGLNEEAVWNLQHFLVSSQFKLNKEDFKSFEEYEDGKKKLKEYMLNMANIANTFIARGDFVNLLCNVLEIQRCSAEWIEMYKEGFRHHGADFLGTKETTEVENKCDLLVLDCNRWLDVFIKNYDNRYKNKTFEFLGKFEIIEEIRKEILSESEETNNGNNNPTNE